MRRSHIVYIGHNTHAEVPIATIDIFACMF